MQFSVEPATGELLRYDYSRREYFTKAVAPDAGARRNGYRDYFGAETALRIASARAMLQLVLESARHAPERLVDIGSGAGHLVGHALKRGIAARGIDVSAYAVEQARERWGPHFDAIEDLLGVLRDEPAWQADVISMIDVFEHVLDPVGVLAELRRHLAPDGLILIVVPDADGWLARRDGGGWVHYSPDHVFHYSAPAIERIARRADRRYVVGVERLAERLVQIGDDVDPQVLAKYTRDRDHLIATLR